MTAAETKNIAKLKSFTAQVNQTNNTLQQELIKIKKTLQYISQTNRD